MVIEKIVGMLNFVKSEIGFFQTVKYSEDIRADFTELEGNLLLANINTKDQIRFIGDEHQRFISYPVTFYALVDEDTYLLPLLRNLLRTVKFVELIEVEIDSERIYQRITNEDLRSNKQIIRLSTILTEPFIMDDCYEQMCENC